MTIQTTEVLGPIAVVRVSDDGFSQLCHVSKNSINSPVRVARSGYLSDDG